MSSVWRCPGYDSGHFVVARTVSRYQTVLLISHSHRTVSDSLALIRWSYTIYSRRSYSRPLEVIREESPEQLPNKQAHKIPGKETRWGQINSRYFCKTNWNFYSSNHCGGRRHHQRPCRGQRQSTGSTIKNLYDSDFVCRWSAHQEGRNYDFLLSLQYRGEYEGTAQPSPSQREPPLCHDGPDLI